LQTHRTHEATLAPSFNSLQLKKFELEFAVDPLFKKASADFDEGGAKGLLLNHLSIDGKGRIVFDSSDDAGDATADGDAAQNAEDHDESAERSRSKSPTPRPRTADSTEEHTEFDLGPLAKQFFPNLDLLEQQSICPSLQGVDLGDPSGSLDIPFLKAPEDWRQDKPNESDEQPGLRDASGIMLDDDMAIGFDDDDGTITGFDLGTDAGFGEGGEAWAREAALEPMLQVRRIDDGNADNDGSGMDVLDSVENDPYSITLSHQSANREHENILSYFDNALKKDWAGPEHWKIRRLKETASSAAPTTAPKQRKEKEKFEIDFSSPLDHSLAELIYTAASSNSAISFPKTQWKTKGRNLLPDDKHFNSRQLLRLFLKPKARMGLRSLGSGRRQSTRVQRDLSSSNNGEMDEAFWASHKPEMGHGSGEDPTPAGDYDANFFADDGLPFPNGMPDDDDDNMPFADAREAFSPSVDPNAPAGSSATDSGGVSGLTALLNAAATPGGALTGGFGSQLVTQGGRRVRPEYVAYARVAKKVDVRRLKEEMWKGMGDRLIASSTFSSSSSAAAVMSATPSAPAPIPSNNDPSVPPATENQQEPMGDLTEQQLRFTDVMKGLKSSYPEQTMRDISTSYCFICLLHLANEKGLVLNNVGGAEGEWDGRLEEVYVTKDAGAVIEGEV
jgi:condensin complex subunit 2